MGFQAGTPSEDGRKVTLRPSEHRRLRTMARSFRHARSVSRTFGLDSRFSSRTGSILLFTGSSRGRRALAAATFAADLGAALLRIDLSRTVSRFIGETEKNIERSLVTAEASGAILLFDEADSLFGKRTGVEDSHDRYANTETSFLLQRLEHHGGIVILSTNSNDELDDAFLRRIHHVLQFQPD